MFNSKEKQANIYSINDNLGWKVILLKFNPL